jgi:hypothetical protein
MRNSPISNRSAQVEQAFAWGVDVTHLDAHMGTMQVDRRYFEIYLRLAQAFGLPLRMVSARHEERMGFECRKPAARGGIVFPDNFIAPRWGQPACATLRAAIANLRAGVPSPGRRRAGASRL